MSAGCAAKYGCALLVFAVIGVGCSEDTVAPSADGMGERADTTDPSRGGDGGDVSATDGANPDSGGPTPVDYYFVIDGSGPQSYLDAVREFTDAFAQEVQDPEAEHRIGVTNMQPANDGELVRPQGWFESRSKMTAAVDAAALDCTSEAEWTCAGSEPHGLQVARSGVERMSGGGPADAGDRTGFRPDARRVIVFLTDERPQSVVEGTSVDSYRTFFERRAVPFAFSSRYCTGPDAGSGSDDAYSEVAIGAGGKVGGLCENISQLPRQVIFASL